jgi:GNAT superfamily N-acetyltransferase
MSEPKRPVRLIRHDEYDTVLAIINIAAQRYRGVIPADCWHDPYFSPEYLASEVAAGVRFFGYEAGDELLGVMGAQDVDDVTLVRHAYVLPQAQRAGVGGTLLRSLLATTDKLALVGTWAAAGWAIAFYEKQGFAYVGDVEKTRLLRQYWSIPERQIETSVVLVGRRPHLPNSRLVGSPSSHCLPEAADCPSATRMTPRAPVSLPPAGTEGCCSQRRLPRRRRSALTCPPGAPERPQGSSSSSRCGPRPPGRCHPACWSATPREDQNCW